MFRSTFVRKVLCSELLRKYAELRPSRTEMPFVTSKFLCSEYPMFRRAYVPTVKRQVQVELIIYNLGELVICQGKSNKLGLSFAKLMVN